MRKTIWLALLMMLVLVAMAPAAVIFTAVDTEAPLTDLTVDVKIEDVTGGVKISLTLNPSSLGEIGDITGLYLNYDGSVPVAMTISGVSSNDAGADASDIVYSTNQSFPPLGTFDMLFDVGGPGANSAGLDVQWIIFTAIGTPLLTAENFEAAAVRVQSFGLPDSGRQGSLKLIDRDPTTVPDTPDEENPIPEPSTWLMMGAGLGLVSLAKMRRSRRS